MRAEVLSRKADDVGAITFSRTGNLATGVIRKFGQGPCSSGASGAASPSRTHSIRPRIRSHRRGFPHRTFGLPNLEFTESETEWPRKMGMNTVMSMRMDMPGELPEPMNPMAAADVLNTKDGYEMTETDEQMKATGQGQLFGQFPLDREGIVRWSFAEVPEGGHRMFGAPSPRELKSAASQVAG
jgi:hypothetical protein